MIQLFEGKMGITRDDVWRGWREGEELDELVADVDVRRDGPMEECFCINMTVPMA